MRQVRVTIQRRRLPGDVDASPGEWVTIVSRYWVTLEAKGDVEREEGNGVGHNVTFSCVGRFVEAIQPQDRMTIDGTSRQLTIVAAFDPDGTREETHLQAVERI